jgi:hypothetical protein
MLFFHETSHQGTGQFHTHLRTVKLPQRNLRRRRMNLHLRRRCLKWCRQYPTLVMNLL